MFIILLTLGLTLLAVNSDEFAAEVRLHLPKTQKDVENNCELLVNRSTKLWNSGGFQNCIPGTPIITQRGFIAPYSVTVNTEHIEKFAESLAISDKFAFINRELNSDADRCNTGTGPNWQDTLHKFANIYPLNIHFYTTFDEMGTITCEAISKILKVRSPLVAPIACKHEETLSELPQICHHRFEVTMMMPELDDHQPTETVLQRIILIQKLLEFEGSNCTPFTLPVYRPLLHTWDFEMPLNMNSASILNCDTIRDRSTCPLYSCKLEILQSKQILYLQFPADICGQLDDFKDEKQAAFLVHSFLNEKNTSCLVIQYKETKDAFVKVPHKLYFFALVSGPSYVDVCQKARNQIPYDAPICDELPNGIRIYANKRQRIFRIRPTELIYFADIPWYMNEHSKFVFFLNRHSPNCVFNGYVQLNMDSSPS